MLPHGRSMHTTESVQGRMCAQPVSRGAKGSAREEYIEAVGAHAATAARDLAEQ